MNQEIYPVLEALLQNKGLQSIADEAAALLGNPFWIVDMNSKFIANLSGETHNEHLLNENSLGYVADDIILYVNKKSVRKHIKLAEGVYSFYTHDNQSKIITCEVRIENTTVAYISSLEENRIFTTNDSNNLTIISQIISTELQKDSFYRDNKEMMYSYFLSDLLENRIPTTNIKKRLIAIGYHPLNYYYLLTVALPFTENRKIVLSSIYKQIHFICKNSIDCLYNNHYVFLFTTEKILKDDETIFTQLHKFLLESNLHAAISDSFNNVAYVPRHHAKTLDAIRLGRQSLPNTHFYRYSSMIIHHAADILNRIISYSDFCNGAIDKLLAYDQTHHSNLLETLYCYLTKNCKIVPSASEMSLHQNTLRKRIEKIEEIINLNLDNGYQTFELMLALTLYKDSLTKKDV